MARILCIWEMGAALGHLTNLRLFIDEALKRGHEVSVAVRELHNVSLIIDPSSVSLYLSPHIRRPARQYSTPIASYADLIERQVFFSEQELKLLYRGWQSIFDAVQPDLVIYDHAPAALVASVGKPWQKWVVGSGFLVPMTENGYFKSFPGVPNSDLVMENFQTVHQRVLSCVNAVLTSEKVAPLDRLVTLLEQCDKQLLMTLPELDHYGVRSEGHYIGLKWSCAETKPSWPQVNGRKKIRAFAYLSYFKALPKLLDCLIDNHVELLIYARDLPGALIKDYRHQVTFSETPVDLGAVFEQAGLFINHANHGSSAQALVSGVSQLMIPKYQEQLFLGQKVEALNAGVVAFRDQPDFTEPVARAIKLTHNPITQVSWDPDQLQRELQLCFDEFESV